MRFNLRSTILFLLVLSTQLTLAQVDVVYNHLVWSDEFNTNGAVNPDKWLHQTQLPGSGTWYNGEIQHYTNRIENSYVDDGLLNIVAIKEDFTDQGVTKLYTSARLNSKFTFTYGRVDVRAKLPIEKGTWPAIWTLGINVSKRGCDSDPDCVVVGWPACGEIDIMEHGIFPEEPLNFVQAAMHTPSSHGNTIDRCGLVATDVENEYHVYSMNWSPNQITFLIDDVVYYIYNPAVKDANTWPFYKDQFILLNVAIGGNAGNPEPSFIQSGMEVDYVRVYQSKPLSAK